MAKRPRNSKWLVALIVFHALFLLSPIVYFLGFRASVAIPVTLALLLSIVAVRNRKIPNWAVLFFLASLMTACITGVYWESWRAALLPAYLAVSVLTVSAATEDELRSVVDISSMILLILLIGGWIALALAFSGISALGTTSGLNDRVLYVYFTTLTPVVVGHFIRPSGIYDEPGALSFVICLFAFLRHLMKMDRRFTWILLSLGFVTFSVAHLIYVAFHFMSERRIFVAWINLLVVSVAAIWVLSSLGLWETFDARLVARLSISSESGKIIEGDNRTENLVDAGGVVAEGAPRLLLFGIDVACIEGSTMCTQEHPGLGFNPLSPLVYFGFLISWPYYLFLILSIGVGVLRRTWWPLVAVGLLFMQRPNLLSAGYSMLGALVFVAGVRWRVFGDGVAALVGRRARRNVQQEATSYGR